MKRFILATVVPTLVAASIVTGYYQLDSHKGLDDCAKANNVYSCIWIAVPEQEPETREVMAPVLPPPVL